MLNPTDLFNERYYLAQNPDVVKLIQNGTFVNGYDHFQRVGKFAGLNPSPLFDTRYYLANNPQVAAAVNQKQITAFDDFILNGQKQNLDPSPIFSHQDYYNIYPDVKAAVDRDILTGIEHFVKYGQYENRHPRAEYNEKYYLSKNPDLVEPIKQGIITPVSHYLNFGAAEGREVSPFVKAGNSTLPNGVAAGDTTQNTSVLWTRTIVPGIVQFDYSTDANFNTLAGSQTALSKDPTIPVKVQISGLNPNTQYYYRVTDSAGTTATGKFRTAALAGTKTGLRFGVAPDWQGQTAPFPAISNAADRNLDFFMLLGDTVYADDISPDLPDVKQPKELGQFRTKYNEVYSPKFGVNSWGNIRGNSSIYATWDDHELTNDFAGGATAASSPQKEGIFGTNNQLVNETPVFKDALKAFQEYLPVRDDYYSYTGDTRTTNKQKLYRYNNFGSDAATFVLDLRSFRDNSLKSIPETSDQTTVNKFLTDAFDPNRTMLGKDQLAELKRDLLSAKNAGINWKFIMSSDPLQNFGIPVAGDRWEGYAAERTEILKFIKENDIKNVVFVSGDFHGYVVNNLTYQEGPGQPQIPTDAIDIMTGPVAFQANLGQGPVAAPFGVATVAFTPNAILPQTEKDRYNSLPTPEAKDQFVKELINRRIEPLGYNPIGLEDSGLDAKLIKGDYIAAHAYTWTEFDIDRNTQQLTVTTYGITPYTQAEMEANPTLIAGQKPSIVSQFTLNPKV